MAGRIEAAGGFAQLLVSMDLLDPPPQPAVELEQHQPSTSNRSSSAVGAANMAAGSAAGQAGEQPAARRWWHEYLPIKRVGAELVDALCRFCSAWQPATFQQPCTCPPNATRERLYASTQPFLAQSARPILPSAWLPLAQMSDEEWERYKSQQDEVQRKR